MKPLLQVAAGNYGKEASLGYGYWKGWMRACIITKSKLWTLCRSFNPAVTIITTLTLMQQGSPSILSWQLTLRLIRLILNISQIKYRLGSWGAMLKQQMFPEVVQVWQSPIMGWWMSFRVRVFSNTLYGFACGPQTCRATAGSKAWRMAGLQHDG